MSELRQTPLHDTHVQSGGRMVEFGGWSMPSSYGSQLEEHHSVRRHAGMFDVSHMTIVDVSGGDAEKFLRRVLANDVLRLRSTEAETYRALYSCMLREDGGILDDLIVYRLTDDVFRLVVNASTRGKDLDWLVTQAGEQSVRIIERPELAMIAVQGPRARALTASTSRHGERLMALPPFRALEADDIFVARTGYTGEDGFEIMIAAAAAVPFWETLDATGVSPCGLGARDTLRLEAGLNLYGLDMDETVTPLECGLRWTVDLRADRDFIGRHALEERLAAPPSVERKGLVLEGRGVLRAGYGVHTPAGDGAITSGTFAPTLNRSIALARVPVNAGDRCEVSIRDRKLFARIVEPPFVRHGEVQADINNENQ